MKGSTTDLTVMGQISSHYGVKGWVRVKTFTRPPEDILNHAIWTLTPGRESVSGDRVRIRSPEARSVENSRWQSRGLIVKLGGLDSRDDADPLIGAHVCIPTGDLPRLPEGEYYWSELIGLEVTNLEGEELGIVVDLMETGANDVLMVESEQDGTEKRERLVPWIPQVIRSVDLESGRLVVDWDPEF